MTHSWLFRVHNLLTRRLTTRKGRADIFAGGRVYLLFASYTWYRAGKTSTSMGKNINTRMAPKSWVACTKPEGKGMNSKTSVKADKRDITLLVLLLRHRITPPVPYIIITEIILSMSPDTYQDSCHKNCRLENLTEEQQYHWFAWWCKEMEKKEIMKGGGRWVAAVNWENERIKEICGCLRDQLQGRGPVFELVDQEGVARLKLQVGQKKQLIKQNKILKEKEDFIRAQEDQSTLQADWYLKNDWRYGSVPDLTLLSPKSVIGQGYPLDDFLRPFDDDLRSWNLTFETASTISAPSTHSSSASLTTWSNSSTITASTMPLGYTDEEEKILKTVNKYKATKKFEKVMDFKEAMRNKLDKLDMAEREGRLVNDWMMTESMVRVC